MRTFDITRPNGDVHTVKVDDEDFERVRAAGRWYVHLNGRTLYVRRSVSRGGKRVTEMLHVFILGMKGIDHINHDGLDNRRENLRPATDTENKQNRPGANRNSKSGIRGVYPDRVGWRAQVKANGRTHCLGTYPDPETAGRVAATWRSVLMPFSHEESGK